MDHAADDATILDRIEARATTRSPIPDRCGLRTESTILDRKANRIAIHGPTSDRGEKRSGPLGRANHAANELGQLAKVFGNAHGH